MFKGEFSVLDKPLMLLLDISAGTEDQAFSHVCLCVMVIDLRRFTGEHHCSQRLAELVKVL